MECIGMNKCIVLNLNALAVVNHSQSGSFERDNLFDAHETVPWAAAECLKWITIMKLYAIFIHRQFS